MSDDAKSSRQEMSPQLRKIYDGFKGSQKVLEATNVAVRTAAVDQHLTAHDAGGVEILRTLARRIDNAELAEKIRRQMLVEGAEVLPEWPLDNTLIPTYLKVLEHLGLTPRSRAYINSIQPKGSHLQPVDGGSGSKLSKFQRG